MKLKISVVFGITCIVCAPAVFAKEKMAPGPSDLYPVYSEDTEIFYGVAPERLNEQQVSFVIDGKHLGFWEKLAFRFGDKDYAAIIFEGSAQDKQRLCPYFSLASRPYTMVQLEKDEVLFTIQSTATDAEIEAIKKSGCMVTDTPDMSKIVYKK